LNPSFPEVISSKQRNGRRTSQDVVFGWQAGMCKTNAKLPTDLDRTTFAFVVTNDNFNIAMSSMVERCPFYLLNNNTFLIKQMVERAETMICQMIMTCRNMRAWTTILASEDISFHADSAEYHSEED